MPLFLWHVSMLYRFSCMLVATQPYGQKIIQYQICSCKYDQDSCKWQLVACQLHSDWLQMISSSDNIEMLFSRILSLGHLEIRWRW
jgi:hypothetical protein